LAAESERSMSGEVRLALAAHLREHPPAATEPPRRES
jgi:hypothetical protein